MRVIAMRKLLNLASFIEMKEKYQVFVEDLSSIALDRVFGIAEYDDDISFDEKL